MVLTPQGRISRYFYGVDFPPKDLRMGLVEASQGKIGNLLDLVAVAPHGDYAGKGAERHDQIDHHVYDDTLYPLGTSCRQSDRL